MLDALKNLIGRSDSRRATHHHRCMRCKTIWEHPDACAGNHEAHRCPRCGLLNYAQHQPAIGERVTFPHPAPRYEESTQP